MTGSMSPQVAAAAGAHGRGSAGAARSRSPSLPWYPAGVCSRSRTPNRPKPQAVWHPGGSVSPRTPKQPWNNRSCSRTPSPGGRQPRRGGGAARRSTTAGGDAGGDAPLAAAPVSAQPAAPQPIAAADAPPAAATGKAAVRSQSYAQPTQSSQLKTASRAGAAAPAAAAAGRRSPSPPARAAAAAAAAGAGGGSPPAARRSGSSPTAGSWRWAQATQSWERRCDRSRRDLTWAERDFWPPAAAPAQAAPAAGPADEAGPPEAGGAGPAAPAPPPHRESPPQQLRELRMQRGADGQLGLVFFGGPSGVRVAQVAAGSPAEAAGAAPGQEIIGVSGVRIRSQREADLAFAAAPRSVTVTVADPGPPARTMSPTAVPHRRAPLSPSAASIAGSGSVRVLSPGEMMQREIQWRDPMSPGRSELRKVEQYELQLRERHLPSMAAHAACLEEAAAEAKALAVLAQRERALADQRRVAEAYADREREYERRRERVQALRAEARQRQGCAARGFAPESGGGRSAAPPYLAGDPLVPQSPGAGRPRAAASGASCASPPPAVSFAPEAVAAAQEGGPPERSMSPQRIGRPRWRM
eukprot:TRINITY_DN12571_c0_g1_i1.p1 TRINITY_DN12571_c0_g1~~TRINITY_DN12571_c0_g1_i1.p1  ORF type:complete len:584 (+),score=102.96 TRINITY_DN12571_c0_g1_i1:78-1829(+)